MSLADDKASLAETGKGLFRPVKKHIELTFPMMEC